MFENGARIFEKDGGVSVSHGDVTEIYAYADELKKSQPIRPVTRFPKASTINKAIALVNPAGTTNIKGVYKDSDRLIIIKYNEVDNWQAIGFPKCVC